MGDANRIEIKEYKIESKVSPVPDHAIRTDSV
jgi:hypothetical protein